MTAGMAQDAKRKPPPVARTNEVTLAGLRPGIDSSARAKSLHKRLLPALNAASEMSYVSECPKQKLTIEVDGNHKIQTVRTDIVIWDGDCLRTGTVWRTGRGLQLLDTVDRVIRIYGPPDSRSPSTKGGQQLELLYYAFDWAGPDVPQVMEVLCTVGKGGEPGRVVEITLAASSL